MNEVIPVYGKDFDYEYKNDEYLFKLYPYGHFLVYRLQKEYHLSRGEFLTTHYDKEKIIKFLKNLLFWLREGVGKFFEKFTDVKAEIKPSSLKEFIEDKRNKILRHKKNQ
jgi:hypothetical protein